MQVPDSFALASMHFLSGLPSADDCVTRNRSSLQRHVPGQRDIMHAWPVHLAVYCVIPLIFPNVTEGPPIPFEQGPRVSGSTSTADRRHLIEPRYVTFDASNFPAASTESLAKSSSYNRLFAVFFSLPAGLRFPSSRG